MNASRRQAAQPTLARTAAGEDLRVGDFVALLNVVYEYPSWLWMSDAAVLPPDQPVRIRLREDSAGEPLRVLDICLPFVFVDTPSGSKRTLDLRGCQLARLDAGFAKRTRKALRGKRKRRRRGRARA